MLMMGAEESVFLINILTDSYESPQLIKLKLKENRHPSLLNSTHIRIKHHPVDIVMARETGIFNVSWYDLLEPLKFLDLFQGVLSMGLPLKFEGYQREIQ